ncbi:MULTISPECIES: glycosyltransferase [unclassified Algoriphagus]|uniref:glycosyltransferase n=1 Tax=unclassified Algoriphagus TaxID=2641541 RepID=UPI002579BCDE|nr:MULTISPECIES: glycosyltransferase [unclassified Algoriphagus]
MKSPTNFLIITHVAHVRFQGKYWGYGPYVREMNLWARNVASVTLLAPLSSKKAPDPIDLPYECSTLRFVQVESFELTSLRSSLKALFFLPSIFFKTWKEIKKSDHVHLRCPGNMGLIGAITQVLFPSKHKTAKYAANWDPSSQQPFTYRLQKKILASQALSKNMRVLTYGNWDSSNQNLVPFFTASYSEKDTKAVKPRQLSLDQKIRLIYVGGLQKAKNPLLSIRVCQKLLENHVEAELNLYGQGPEMEKLLDFVEKNNLSNNVILHGNVNSEELIKAYQNSHFLIFVSESEGWPKVVAESMFWACLPITSPVSCVPQMLGDESRGDLVSNSEDMIFDIICRYVEEPEKYYQKAQSARDWSQKYTLERFEHEIQNLLKN